MRSHSDEVKSLARVRAMVVPPVAIPRVEWAEAAARHAKMKHAGLIDEPTPTRFDEAEWEWK